MTNQLASKADNSITSREIRDQFGLGLPGTIKKELRSHTRRSGVVANIPAQATARTLPVFADKEIMPRNDDKEVRPAALYALHVDHPAMLFNAIDLTSDRPIPVPSNV